MTKFGSYPFLVEPFSEDFLGRLAWGNLGNLILRCATLHAGSHGFGYPQMIRLNQAWVLSRLIIEIDEMPATGERFEIETWVDKVYRQFTDRHFSILRPDGTAYGHATSVWALIDIETRRPTDLTTLPNGGFTEVMIPERPAPVKPSSRLRPKNLTLATTHRAAYTDLDINCHVNSIRYIELMLDTFTPERLKARKLKRIEVAYALETTCGELLYIYKEEVNPELSLFEIRREDGTSVVKGNVLLGEKA